MQASQIARRTPAFTFPFVLQTRFLGDRSGRGGAQVSLRGESGLGVAHLSKLKAFRKKHADEFKPEATSRRARLNMGSVEGTVDGTADGKVEGTAEGLVDIEDLPKKRKLRKFDRVQVDITELATTGEGVAKYENGMVIFVERAHPGARVIAEVYNRKRDHAFAKVVEVLQPSQDTVKPICRHYPTCRGCRTQDLAYAAQLREKQRQVENLFRAYEGVPVMTIIGSTQEFHYRNKMEFTYGVKRYHPDGPPPKGPQAEEFILGMNAPRAWDKVIELKECHLMPSIGTHILNDARQLTFETKFPAYDNYAHEGFFRNLVMRFAKNGSGEDEIMVNFVTSTTEAVDMLKPIAETLAKSYPTIVSVLHSMTDNKGGSAVAEKEYTIYGKSFIEQKLRGLVFRISSNSFFQPNPRSAERLYEVIEDFAELTPETVLLDLFCGTGTIGLSMAKKCKHVHGIEIVESAVKDAEDNARRNGIVNATFMQKNLDLTKESPYSIELPKAEVVVVDPPRAGLHPKLVKWLRVALPQRIVYASCNPSSQIRDVDRLCLDDGPYRLTKVQPVDQFPHTAHCENVVALELREDYERPSEHYV